MALELLDQNGKVIVYNAPRIERHKKKLSIFGDNIGEVEKWNFSFANYSQELRVEAISKVASICYGNEGKICSPNLYDKLKRESLGLPSSSFEFVPILLRPEDYNTLMDAFMSGAQISNSLSQLPDIERYGYKIGKYQMTNLRALMSDLKAIEETYGSKDEVSGEGSEEYKSLLDVENRYFNTADEEIEIIENFFHVYLSKIDIVTARQFMRHRTSWQELSRRYTSGKKVPFEVYLNDSFSETSVTHKDVKISAEELAQLCIDMYDAAVASGVKPEEARRIIPQGAYTSVWSAWFEPQMNEMIKLRTDKSAQWEVRTLAKAMSDMVN